MNIRKTIYGLAALASMYGAIASFNQFYSLQEPIDKIREDTKIQRVRTLYPEFDDRIKSSLLRKRDFKELTRVCSELDNLKQEGAFEQIKKANNLEFSMGGYAAASVFSGFASLVLAGLSLGYIRRENKTWVIGRRKKEN